MSSQTTIDVSEELRYPTSDGKPMAETDIHRDDMCDLIDCLKHRYEDDPQVYVSGNLLLFYERGNKRRHVSPDVFVVKGIIKRKRPNYLLWREKKGPDFVIEITSKTTKKEDLKKKFELYRDVLKVTEYFLFDPQGEYLDPSLQGYRLHQGEYVPIEFEDDRLPSRILNLHLERDGKELRLFDTESGKWLETPDEVWQDRSKARESLQHESNKRLRAETARQQAETARQQAETARQEEADSRQRAEQEVEKLRLELESLRRRQTPQS